MWSLGFGLEKLGVVALRFPKLASLFLLLVTGFALFALPNLQFEGNVTAVLPKNSKAFIDYRSTNKDFRDFSTDITLIVRSDDLMSAERLEVLRSLQLDLSVLDYVDQVTSIFSIPKLSEDGSEFEPYFPEQLESDQQAKTLIEDLIKTHPQVGNLIVPDHGLAVLAISFKHVEGSATDDVAYKRYLALKKEIEFLDPEGLEILYTGLTPLGATIAGSLLGDQIKLTLIGLLLGTGIGFYIFRSALAALLCAIPPAFTAIWTLAIFAVVQSPLSYLTTILPTLALVLAFADGIVLYYKWQVSNAAHDDFSHNLENAVRKVGPASALTSITTAIAFGSFYLSSSEVLQEFALLGSSAVFGAFVAVIIGLPVAGYWAITLNLIRPGKVHKPAFERLGQSIHRRVVQRFGAIAVGGLVLAGLLSYFHNQIYPEFRLTNYLPKQSDSYKAEKIANQYFAGGSVLLVRLPLVDTDRVDSPANRKLLSEVEAGLVDLFGARSVSSLNRYWQQIKPGGKAEQLVDQFLKNGDNGRSSFIPEDKKSLLITVRIPSDQAIVVTRQEMDKIAAIAAKAGAPDVAFSGLPALMATEFTRLIDQLRRSLMLAIALGILMVAFATRAPFLAVAAITPNLLPILFVEFVIYVRGSGVNLSEVVSLTIAFGIAIDNAVHMINVLDQARRSGLGIRDGIRAAVCDIGPALGASTLILCVSLLVTQISVMPMVPILGRLMIATLIIALLSNLALLPSNVLAMRSVMPKWRAQDRNQS